MAIRHRDLRVGIVEILLGALRWRVSLGRWGGFPIPQSQMLGYFLHDLLVLNRAYNSHSALALRTDKEVHLVDLLNKPGPVLSVVL
jgi:hypothetical protein